MRDEEDILEDVNGDESHHILTNHSKLILEVLLDIRTILREQYGNT